VASLFRSGREEGDLAREIDAHLQLLEDQFVAKGMSRDDAKFAARRTFGGVEQTKERQRDARAFRWLDSSWLDLKLGARLLVKYPGLTLVGGCAMAFGIAVGATAFEAGQQIISPVIPLDEGDRIVGIRLRDAATTDIEPRVAHDFFTWRAGLDVIEDVGAVRIVEQNLASDGGPVEPVEIAEISASAFTLARVQPLIGRTLTAADDMPGAAPVVVIGYDLWRTRFAADPQVIGRVVRLGTSQVAVVGVMPERFAFPIRQSIWMPLRLQAGEYPPRGGPPLRVFARLADGVSLEQAQATLTVMGQRTATAFPSTHTQLRPEVVPYAKSIVDLFEVAIGVAAVNIFVVMFLVLVCANVGSLVFARTVTRHNEIIVRSALGATHGRIVMQLFAEALVLATVAAVIGLVVSNQALEWLYRVRVADRGQALPFWIHATLSPSTIFYTCALTALGAVFAGVVPALKVTGRRLESRLRQSALGDSGLTFGGMWTVVIVVQIGVTVAFPAAAFLIRQGVLRSQSADAGFAVREYLSARLDLDAEDRQGRLRRTLDELQRRLSSEPLVTGVTFTDVLPRTLYPTRFMELEPLDGSASQPKPAERVRRASVASNYFDVLGLPVLAGRSFGSGDSEQSASAVIVNRSFVDGMAGGNNPIGRRVRYAASRTEPVSRWYEIVGVVRDMRTTADDPREAAAIYHPAPPDGMTPVQIAMHIRGDPASFTPRLRSVAATVDPTLRVNDVLPVDQVGAGLWLELDFLWRVLVVVSVIGLLLSLTGIYSIMSLTVSRRTREIGIRVALGASRWRVTGAVCARAVGQLSVGIAGGSVLVFALTKLLSNLSMREVAAITIYVAIMMTVCLLACVVPIRRALGVEPKEALRAE
jgi:predicted permease